MGVSAQIVRAIAPRDKMHRGDDRVYFEIGREAIELIQSAIAFEPTAILDMPCGHGRVLRWLRAAYPDSRITACDLHRDGVDFCAETFHATPVYGSEDPGEVELGDDAFDLIWVGSFFTHLAADRWRGFLRLFASHLSPARGRLIFTTGGEVAVERIRRRDGRGVAKPSEKGALADYEQSGFGFAEHRPGTGWGIARASERWVRDVLADTSLEVVTYQPGAWGKRQDVYVATREE